MERLTYDEVITRVEDLTPERLDALVAQQLVQPVQSAEGVVFRDLDVARARLCCELVADFGLSDEAVALVLSLLDEMHGLRGEMRDLLAALGEEPDETRARITMRVRHTRGLG